MTWMTSPTNEAQGLTVTFTAPEDENSVDDVALMSNFVRPLPYASCESCKDETDEEQCRQDSREAWANSPYRQLSGADVLIAVRDND